MIKRTEEKRQGKNQGTDIGNWHAISALLGFANKAGKLKFGLSACYQSCAHKKAKLILLASDLGENTIRKIELIIKQNRIKTIVYGTKEQYGLLFNRSNTGLISVEDRDFAAGIEKVVA